MADEEKEVKAPETAEDTSKETEEKVTESLSSTSDDSEKTAETEKPSTEAANTPVVEANTDTKENTAPEIPSVEEGEKVTVEELPHDDLETGMLVRVHERIKDTNNKGEARERIQIFEGLVMNVRGGGASRTVTVRKNSKGWMVEKIFPLSSPNLTKVEVVKKYRVRRAKLSYLKGKFKRKLKEVKKAK